MKVYNTLTRTKEEFVPLEEGKVKMYVCGPTVYNYIHIGNARPMIVFDTVRRYFEYKGYDVNYVSNFTDVDDKIIKKANEEGVSATEISERYIQAVKEDMKNLNVKPATTHPKATEEIDGMIDMIQTLIDKGHAYEKNGTVYFRTRSFDDYGKLSKKNIDDLEAGHRDIKVAGEEEKEDPMDFVLWKPKKEGEPSWPSPWSDGRPGWHIECSVMSKKYLGEQIDIHAGGEDLIFPHHENEIAQSEATNGKEFSKYWLHNGFLNIDNKKMSKSEGNFFTVREIGEKYPYEVLRFFMLSGAHYRMPLNFSRELMEAAKNGLERIVTAVEKVKGLMEKAEEKPLTAEEKEFLTELERLNEKFDAAMDDDFNTADAVSAIFELVKLTNTRMKESSSKEAVEKAYGKLTLLCGILGIEAERKEELLDADVEALIEERQTARKNRDFARADEIRNELLEKGIVLEDTREGVRWKRA
ncbi:cysteine--tRNA ligase [Acetivibrio ethanolgignens]|uniref:Cysteine--tRNA ligase n=1 Tax=Acetivibrio ethanolgignens TaxID=290052 RepID=A0A0V8QF34_9FIRM|nr:cysteine--tRNA ligase [Acetivibrio ethanolgignens]KSV59082.1 cysteinyl-tRNA synthetase [Acetivibrio ethanolgignens]